MTLIAAFEGDTDLPIVEKLARDAGLNIAYAIDCAGKPSLDAEFESYNRAAKGSPWFVLRDLDHDATCAAEYLEDQECAPSAWMCFRLAVRELESWLLADAEAIAQFFHVPLGRVPVAPDDEDDPTRALVNLVRHSTKARIRRAMIPRPGVSTTVGRDYEGMIIEFGRDHWSLARAAKSSGSLRRARVALRDLGKRWRASITGNS